MTRGGVIGGANADGGCSRNSLYAAMRLSFAFTVLHVFAVLVPLHLHVTYVRPRAFRRRGGGAAGRTGGTAASRWQWSGRSLIGRDDHRDHAPLMIGKGDGEPAGGAEVPLYNCQAYALSTCPVEERSSYFGEEEKDGEVVRGCLLGQRRQWQRRKENARRCRGRRGRLAIPSRRSL